MGPQWGGLTSQVRARVMRRPTRIMRRTIPRIPIPSRTKVENTTASCATHEMVTLTISNRPLKVQGQLLRQSACVTSSAFRGQNSNINWRWKCFSWPVSFVPIVSLSSFSGSDLIPCVVSTCSFLVRKIFNLFYFFKISSPVVKNNLFIWK